MPIPKEALDLIKSNEGYLRRLRDADDSVAPYRCPAGVPTVGWGSTRSFPDRKRITMDTPPITREVATRYLMGEIGLECEPAVDALTTRKLHPLSRGALISLCFNIGTGAYRASTLRRVINAGDWDSVPGQFAKWRIGGGRVLAGLVRRRREEAAMFMKGVALLEAGQVAYEDEPQAPEAPAHDLPQAPQPLPPAKSVWSKFKDWFFKGDTHVAR